MNYNFKTKLKKKIDEITDLMFDIFVTTKNQLVPQNLNQILWRQSIPHVN